jgi:endonuclease-8
VPEGPEIRRAADRIERAIAGRATTRVEFAFPRLRRFQKRLSGAAVREVETRGKALLIRFNGVDGVDDVPGDPVIYTHSQLYGRWYVTAAGALPRTGRTLRLAIHTAERSALLYSASEIDVLPSARLGEHPFLAKLGPDALGRELTDAALARHVAEPRHARRQLHALLLDQSFVAGIGNYLRSEILYVAQLHPTWRPGELAAGELRRLARAIRRVAHRSYRTGGITNDERRARRLKALGLHRSAYRHHVFGRGGSPCWTCTTPIQHVVLGGRKLFLCPTCQPAER